MGKKEKEGNVDVACAVIRRGGKILITQRRVGDHLGGLWEFPGGKRISAESLGQCLVREIFEELRIQIQPSRFLCRIDYCYSDLKVSLYFYECELLHGQPRLLGCQALCWVWPFELKRFAFPPADKPILDYLFNIVI